MSGVHVSGEYAKQEPYYVPRVLARNQVILSNQVIFCANEPQLDTHLQAKNDSRFDFSDIHPPTPLLFPNMNRKSEDNKVCKREDIISLEYYIANLLFVLEYACIWPVKSFSPLKVLFSTVATIVFILTNFLLLFSEIVALAMSNDLKIFANIIGAISMHAVGLMKWCYSIWKNREIIDLVRKLEKCHVFCQRIDNSKESMSINYYYQCNLCVFFSKVFKISWQIYFKSLSVRDK